MHYKEAPMSNAIILADAWRVIYDDATIDAISRLVSLPDRPYTSKEPENYLPLLADVEYIFSGWGMAKADEAFLSAAPKLKAIFYGAGSVKGYVTDAMWARGVRVCSAWGANAIPVAEYTLGHILLALKGNLAAGAAYKSSQGKTRYTFTPAGGYRSIVGIVSAGMIGRRVIAHLHSVLPQVDVLVYDPFLTPQQAADFGITLTDLPNLFANADIVSLHTPDLPETKGMITGEMIASMKPHATLINSARGAVIEEECMLDVLEQRPDLQAVLDVTHPEPPRDNSRLFTLPNVFLTPHIAGSIGPECARHGVYMLEELRRLLAGEPLQWELNSQRVKTMA